MAAAVGSLIIRRTFNPAILPASFGRSVWLSQHVQPHLGLRARSAVGLLDLVWSRVPNARFCKFKVRDFVGHEHAGGQSGFMGKQGVDRGAQTWVQVGGD